MVTLEICKIEVAVDLAKLIYARDILKVKEIYLPEGAHLEEREAQS